MNKQMAVLLGIIGMFFAVTFIFIMQWVQPSVNYPQAKNGVLDAREWNFAEQGFVPLRGEWDFYEGKLLTPEDLPSLKPDIQAIPALVPGGWREMEGFSNKKGFGAGTYHLKIYVSESDIYSLRGKKMRMSSHIFMNDSDLGGTGRTSLSPDAFISSNIPFIGTAYSNGQLFFAESPDSEIIFVTAFHEYAIEAFETNAIGYLLKPVVKDKLASTVYRYMNMQAKAIRRMGDSAPAGIVPNGEAASLSSASHSLHLKAMGSLELYQADGTLVTWRTKKTKELFAYLWSFAGAPVYRYYILNDLWPDLDVERAQTLFHTTLYNLRTTLKKAGFIEAVAFGDERYWLTSTEMASDVTDLENMLADHSGRYDAADLLLLYRGDFLEMEHYSWAEPKRHQLRTSTVLRLEQLIAETNSSMKEQLLRKLIELDPYGLNNYDHLIQHFRQEGNRAAARKVDEQRLNIIGNELGAGIGRRRR